MKFLIKLAYFTLLILSNYLVLAQNKRDTLNVLFVGNSYTYFSNMPQIVSLISDSTHTKLITKKSTAGGVSLSQHWRGEKGLKTKGIIKNGNFDIVVLQEQSLGTIEQADSFLIYSRKLCEFIKENNAIPYFYSTWARKKVPQSQETITKVYTQASNENDAGIALVGEAWALAQKLRSNIELYNSDGSHPSPLGTFLTACVFVEAFTNEMPDKLPNRYNTLDTYGESIILMRLDHLDIAFCLKVAEDIARK